MDTRKEPDTVGRGRKRICIVGAGLTGLSTCKHLLQHGLEPTVFEAADGVGGIWRRTCATTRLQNSFPTYQFSDFPWPAGTPKYPSHNEVVEYLESYAKHFRLMNRIRFGWKVLEIRRVKKSATKSIENSAEGQGCTIGADGKITSGNNVFWEVIVEKNCNDTLKESANRREVLQFNFIVLCVGRFGEVPRMPSFPPNKGPEIFKGKVLHAMHYSALDEESARELLKGKRVIVVGLQKSAMEIAVEASIANRDAPNYPCTLIYRRAHWFIPHLSPWGVNLGYLFFTRFAELLAHKPGQGFLLDCLSRLLSPVKWALSKFVELYLLLKLPLRQHGLIPDTSFYEHVSSCVVPLLPENFLTEVEEGRIRLQKSPNWTFSENGVIIDDGSEIGADVVIFATGYNSEAKLLSLLPNDYKRLLLDSTGLVPLYRGIIHPTIPDLAILGYQMTFSNLHSAEMSARWLAYMLSSRFDLPDVKTMEEDSKKWTDYISSSDFPGRVCVGLVHIWRADQLCKDIGWNPKRKNTWLQEFFSPYTNMDYQDAAAVEEEEEEEEEAADEEQQA